MDDYDYMYTSYMYVYDNEKQPSEVDQSKDALREVRAVD